MKIESILTHCEYEVFERIALGESQKEVAEHTFRSVFTVQTTLKNVYAKLGISKATEATLLYCSYAFNIAEQLSKKCKSLNIHSKGFVAILLLLCHFALCVQCNIDPFRINRRLRRRTETEVIVVRYKKSA